MDEQKVEASMIAARVPQVEPALADAEEFPSLGSQPAAAAPTPAEPNPSTIPSPSQSVPSSSAQVPPTPAALVNIQLYILPPDGTASNRAVSPGIAHRNIALLPLSHTPPPGANGKLASCMTFSQIMSSGGCFV